MELPICQMCQTKKATVSFSSWRSGRYLERTFVCNDCAASFEKLHYGGSERVARLIMGATADRAKAAGIDPATDCSGCGTSLVDILTNATTGCELCYQEFVYEIIHAIQTIQGWDAHVGKLPNG